MAIQLGFFWYVLLTSLDSHLWAASFHRERSDSKLSSGIVSTGQLDSSAARLGLASSAASSRFSAMINRQAANGPATSECWMEQRGAVGEESSPLTVRCSRTAGVGVEPYCHRFGYFRNS